MIRDYRPTDREALYRICLETGDAGDDATAQFADPALLGQVFVGPYTAITPDLAWVVDVGDGPEGYVVGTDRTEWFAMESERRWWPTLRKQYAGVRPGAGVRDAWLLRWIETPPPPPAISTSYPAHLHIDLLPTCQGGGWGRALMDRFMVEMTRRAVVGVHLGVDRRNERAAGFYEHLGFKRVDGDDDTIWMGQSLR